MRIYFSYIKAPRCSNPEQFRSFDTYSLFLKKIKMIYDRKRIPSIFDSFSYRKQ